MNSSWASKSLKSMEPNPFGAIRQKLQGKKNVINLSSGDPEFSTPSHIVKAAYHAILDGETHYTMTSGIPELRNEISNYYKKFNVDVKSDSDNIILTIESDNISGLLAGINSYMRLIRVAKNGMEEIK